MRLIDLRIDWLRQYAPEATLPLAPMSAELIAAGRRQVEGYLGATRACIGLAPVPHNALNPWQSLCDLLARYEAEFCGRLLYGPGDLERYASEPDGLTWTVLAVAGLAQLPPPTAEHDPLERLITRGIRWFELAGADSGPLDPAQATSCLERLHNRPGTERFVFGLTGLDPLALSHVLDWFEADPARLLRIKPVWNQCGHEAIGWPEVARARALGAAFGLVPAPPWHGSADDLLRSVDELARLPQPAGNSGVDGLALATSFLEHEASLPGLDTAPALNEWALTRLGADAGGQLLSGTGEELLAWLAAA